MEARKAVSPVVATVIVTSIMLTTVAVAVYFSTSLIDAHRQRMEYESAKELLTYAATALEQVALGTGGARYVRFSLTSTSIDFEKTNLKLLVTITGGGIHYRIEVPLHRVKVCAGSLVTTVDRILYPEMSSRDELGKLVVKAGEPIVLVYENFSRRACAYMEARRVRVIKSGVTYVTEGDQRIAYNFYTIHIINITLGELGGAGTIPLVLRNRGVSIYEYRFRASSAIVTATIGPLQSVETLEGPNDTGGIVVIVKISQVEVSTR